MLRQPEVLSQCVRRAMRTPEEWASSAERHRRSSSNSITSAQVETEGSEVTGILRLAAISCSRPWNRWRAAPSFGREDKVVILDQARVSQTNLINEPGEVGESAEEYFGAAGIWWLSHSR